MDKTKKLLANIEQAGMQMHREWVWQQMLLRVGTYPDPTAPTPRERAAAIREANRVRGKEHPLNHFNI